MANTQIVKKKSFLKQIRTFPLKTTRYVSLIYLE